MRSRPRPRLVRTPTLVPVARGPNAPMPDRRGRVHPRLASALAIVTLGGCATLFRGLSETVTISTQPPGGVVYYEGTTVHDGGQVQVRKTIEPARLNVGTPTRPIYTELNYRPEVLVIGDAAFLLLGILPGVFALGVDVATGAWRDFDELQVVYVPFESDGSAPVALPGATTSPQVEAPVPSD